MCFRNFGGGLDSFWARRAAVDLGPARRNGCARLQIATCMTWSEDNQTDAGAANVHRQAHRLLNSDQHAVIRLSAFERVERFVVIERDNIFSPQEICRLKEASRLVSPTGLRALTYTTLIGLLAATGLRPGEALALDKSDVDLNNGILSIRQSKFGKSRFVPLADSTRAALVNYAKQRDKLPFVSVVLAIMVSARPRHSDSTLLDERPF
jgi:integrase